MEGEGLESIDRINNVLVNENIDVFVMMDLVVDSVKEGGKDDIVLVRCFWKFMCF